MPFIVVDQLMVSLDGGWSATYSREMLYRESEGRLMARYRTTGTRKTKRKKGAPTFVCFIPLRLTPRKVKACETRFEVARLLYNAALGESFNRIKKIKRDPRWENVQAIPKQVGGKSNPGRSALYTALREDYGFTSSALGSYGSLLRKHFVRDHVGAQEAQVIAEHAYDAANAWFVHKRGRPRFKGKGHGMHSLVAKDNNGDIKISKDGSAITWAGISLPFALDPEDLMYWWAAIHVAAKKLLRVGIVRTKIRGVPTYRALFVFDGVALQRYEVGAEKITLDPGLSYANLVTDKGVYREPLAGPDGTDPGIAFDRARIRRLSRRLDREHRGGSPGCFDEKGRHIHGTCRWRNRSKAARTTADQLAEAHRIMASHRRTLHGNLQNRILGIGINLVVEKNSYKSFQRNYGRSVRDRAPGEFVTGLLRKAESAGGVTLKGDPRISAPTQSCVCGARKKKPLSLRVHTCRECGTGPIQRDVFSAFLWRYINADGTLDAPKAREELSRRQDIAVHAVSGDFKQRVPTARKRYGRVGIRVSALELLAAKPQNPAPPADHRSAAPATPETGSATPRAVGRTEPTAAA
jgi:putative transposase